MLLPKPDACKGCVYYGTGQGFVPDDHKPDAKAVVVLQNPGSDEERGQRFVRWGTNGGEVWENVPHRPAIGKSGHELDRVFLPLANLTREDVECRNVLRCRVRGSNELPPLGTKQVREAIRYCNEAHWKPLQAGQQVIALGAYSLWALTGEFGAEGAEDDDDDSRASRSLDGWRGWAVGWKPQFFATGPAPKSVFVSYHPAYFFRVHWLKAVGRMDWARFGRLLGGRWPEPTPAIVRDTPASWPGELAFDTEYWPNDGRLIRYSVAWRDVEVPRVHVVEAGDIRLLSSPPPGRVIQHNAEADWPYLASIFGVDRPEWDDTMMMHSVLYGTWRHTLDFLGSLYARTNRWKHLEQSEPITYAGLDALGTWDVWRALQRELARDSESDAVYTQELKPLLKHLMRRPAIRVATDRVAAAVEFYGAKQKEALARGQAAAGWPLSVTSADQVSRWLGIKN